VGGWVGGWVGAGAPPRSLAYVWPLTDNWVPLQLITGWVIIMAFNWLLGYGWVAVANDLPCRARGQGERKTEVPPPPALAGGLGDVLIIFISSEYSPAGATC